MKSTERQNALMALKRSEGWKIVKEWMEEEIRSKEYVIFSVRPEHNETKYTEKDTNILERSYLLTLINLPDEIISSIESESVEVEKDSNIAVPSII